MKPLGCCVLVGAVLGVLACAPSPLVAQGSGVNDRIQEHDYRTAGLGAGRSPNIFGVDHASNLGRRYREMPDTVEAASPDLFGVQAGPAAPPVRAGVELQTGTRYTPIMLGQRRLGQIPPGQLLSVWEVRGPWIGTSVTIAGRQVQGWIHLDDIAPVLVATRPVAR